MPDISMCQGEKPGWVCPLRDDCYRYKAVPGFVQSWFMEPPYNIVGCDYQMPLHKPRKKRALRRHRPRSSQNLGGGAEG